MVQNNVLLSCGVKRLTLGAYPGGPESPLSPLAPLGP